MSEHYKKVPSTKVQLSPNRSRGGLSPLPSVSNRNRLNLPKNSSRTRISKETCTSTMEIKNRSDWIVIGISGVTCGGKTTLTNRLMLALTPVYSFNQDKYFYPDDSPNHIRCEGLDHNNYDVLSALDMAGMYRDVVATMAGEDKSHMCSVERRDRLEIAGKKFLIVDGFTVLNYPKFMNLCDLRYYFVLEYGECFMRRSLRVYDPPDVDGYFERCVWPAHLNYRAEVERDPRVCIIDGATTDALDIVLHDLRAKGAANAT